MFERTIKYKEWLMPLLVLRLVAALRCVFSRVLESLRENRGGFINRIGPQPEELKDRDKEEDVGSDKGRAGL
jgi:hypothetical protein